MSMQTANLILQRKMNAEPLPDFPISVGNRTEFEVYPPLTISAYTKSLIFAIENICSTKSTTNKYRKPSNFSIVNQMWSLPFRVQNQSHLPAMNHARNIGSVPPICENLALSYISNFKSAIAAQNSYCKKVALDNYIVMGYNQAKSIMPDPPNPPWLTPQ